MKIIFLNQNSDDSFRNWFLTFQILIFPHMQLQGGQWSDTTEQIFVLIHNTQVVDYHLSNFHVYLLWVNAFLVSAFIDFQM